MPIVPVLPQRDASPAPLPGVRQSSSMPVELLDQGARLQTQLGQGLDQIGGVMAQQATDMQVQANQLRVDDAVNKAKEAAQRRTFDPTSGYTNIKGVNALERTSGMPLSEEYTSDLKKDFSTISESLGNDAQKRAFKQHADAMLVQFNGSLLKHESEQFQAYGLSVREGTIANRMNEIGLYYNDPARVDEAVTSIKAATADIARMQGRSAEWTEAQSRKMASNAHKVALETALQKNDIGFADAYLKRNAKDMDADDILRANGLITKELDAQIVNLTVSNVMSATLPKMQPSDNTRLSNLAGAPKDLAGLVSKAESGGRERDAAGNLITSPKGAQGAMQVMPATAADPGYGVTPAKDSSDAERTRVGRDYLQAMLREFKGNVPQALAAYNAGPDRVKQAVSAAGDADPAGWISKLPAETQGYVSKIMQQYQSGGGAAAKPTLQDVHDQVRQLIGADKPARLKLALDAATHQFEDAQKAIKQQGEEATATAMRALADNGGRFSALPASMRAAVPPEKIDNLITFGKTVAKGDDITNPAVYQRLSDPAFLTKLSEDQFYMLRGELSDADFKHFSTQRAAASGKTVSKVDEVNTQALNMVLNNRLQTLGIDPTPKDATDDAGRVGAIRKFVTDTMLAQQKTLGKQMTDSEVEKHIDSLFAKSVTFRNSFLGFDTGTSSDRLLTLKVGDIPGDTKDQLKVDFKAHGIDNPSDADLLGAYFRLQSLPKRPKPGREFSGKIKPYKGN